MKIYSIKDNIDFNNITLGEPGRLHGGAYYAKIYLDKDQFMFSTPTIQTKNGVVTSGRKKYIDMMFSNDQEFFREFLLNFEEKLKAIILEKSSLWFDNNLEKDDIDYFFNSCIRSYKAKQNLVRTYIYTKDLNDFSVFDENEVIQKYTAINNNNIISLLHLKGIKFTSNSFQLDIEVKQVMTVEDKPLFSKCMLSKNKKEDDTINTEVVSKLDDTINHIESDKETHQGFLEEEEDIQQLEEENVDRPIIEDDSKNNIDTITLETRNVIQTDEEINSTTETLEELTTDISNSVSFDEVNNETQELIQMIDNVDTETDVNNNEYLEKNEENKTTQQVEDDRSEDLGKLSHSIEPVELKEYDLKIEDEERNTIRLRKPKEIYYSIYKNAIERAIQSKKSAILSYLEAQKIKEQYLVNHLEENEEINDNDLELLSQKEFLFEK